ncbi:hypothetical protein GE061_016253 [Apolygus lucorum]|uniref:Odorant receptor n=1 Tax=Apolygus lucorum TaxID=248454 RepID=A0A1Q1NIN9_APOLU|nr:olfactory receptor [Apolygus lucorum]KAF6207804.1 hypothetical protein GE061_016253 [Apolygus lucorum]
MTLKSYIKKTLKWEEPLGLTTMIAVISGAWNTMAPPQSIQRFIYWQSWFQTSTYVLFMMSAGINIFVSTDFFGECLESLHFLVTAFHVFIKYMTMRFRERDFLELFDDIKRVWSGYRIHNEKFLSSTLASVNRTTVIISVCIINVMFVNIGAAVLKNILEPDKIHFPIQIWIPSFCRDSFMYGTIAQVVLFSWPLFIVAQSTTFLNSISVHVEALGLSLAKDIGRQKVWKGDSARRFYKKHQEVISIVSRVNALMAGNWGFEMLCSSLQLTLPAYRTLRALKRNEIEVFNHAVILSLNFMVIYIIFGSGNRILSMGEEINDRLYESDWYKLPVKEKKNVLFMLFRATKPVEYRYKMIHFDLPGFMKVVNTVFSYMALLRFLDGGNDGGNGGLL